MRTIKRRDDYCVYILRCPNGTFYTGYTNNLEARVRRHNAGHGAKYLRGKSPAKVVYVKEYRYYKSALNEERRIKTLSRKVKEKLIKAYTKNIRKEKKVKLLC